MAENGEQGQELRVEGGQTMAEPSNPRHDQHHERHDRMVKSWRERAEFELEHAEARVTSAQTALVHALTYRDECRAEVAAAQHVIDGEQH